MNLQEPPQESTTAGRATSHRPVHRPPRPAPVTYTLNLDIGETDPGHHLIVRSIALTDEALLFEYDYSPELTGDEEIWPNISYNADDPPNWSSGESEADVYPRPGPRARYAWFDFYPTDYERMGRTDRDNLPHRIARLTFDLRTGQARTET